MPATDGSADAPDPGALLDRLREAAGEPDLPPLRLTVPASSARGGVAGRVVTRARQAVLRLIAPTLGDLLAELERDRHRHRSELASLRDRVTRLERRDQPQG